MAVLSLSQQNFGGVHLSQPQLALKEKETGDFTLPKQRVLWQVALLSSAWALT